MKIEEVKRNLNKIVSFREGEYKLTGCILRKSDDRGYFYQAELFDIKNGNSIVIATLEEINAKIK